MQHSQMQNGRRGICLIFTWEVITLTRGLVYDTNIQNNYQSEKLIFIYYEFITLQ